jgi:peptidoglycan/LPS O-acetylase OafA/YrhL
LSAAAPLHPREARFYELDILRGVAALVVVLFHYKHFLLISDAVGFDYAHMPLGAILMPLYLYGQFFVEMFFAISGYVFFWLYAEAISRRRTGAGAFFLARFSRLYPLYIVTLLVVALLQLAYPGDDFIYKQDTPLNFVLNLFMVQQWVPYAVQSFNGPSWSISVEVFLYALFFIVCFFGWNRPWVLAALFVIGAIIRLLSDPTVDFLRGVPSFFQGGLIYYAVRALRRHEVWRRRVMAWLCVLLPVVWIISFARGFRSVNVLAEPGLAGTLLSVPTFLYLVLPLSLLALGLMQTHWRAGCLSRENLHRISWIGDISYSVYLIHFPLQLAIMLGLSGLSLSARLAIFGSPLSLLAFMALASGLGWLSFHYLEMPARHYLSKRLRPLLAQTPAVR